MDSIDVHSDNSSLGNSEEPGSMQGDILDKDSDTLLVETVHFYPALYDKSIKEYHNSEVQQNCWLMISAVVNKPVPDCQKRWNQLRDSFTNEKRRRNEDKRSGSGATKRRGFALYDSMNFLHSHVKQKKTFSNNSSSSLLTTSSAIRPQLINIHQEMQGFVVRNIPAPTSTITSPTNILVPSTSTTNSQNLVELLSPFPPMPELEMSTSPRTSSTPAPSTPSLLLPSTLTRLSAVVTPDLEALGSLTNRSQSDSKEAPSILNKLPYTETSLKTGIQSFNVPAASPPPPRTPTLGSSTPCSTQLSPGSPYSSCSDVSGSFSMDDATQFSIPRKNKLPTSCCTKDSRKSKKVDPVKKSFLSLSAVIQDHFVQKAVIKQPEVTNIAASNIDESFGSFVVSELQRMDEPTKKRKKAQIMQILYE